MLLGCVAALALVLVICRCLAPRRGSPEELRKQQDDITNRYD